MSSDCQILRHCNNERVPEISVTRSHRRVSISSPLRFTRTFSDDSLDSLEKNGRLELRRQQILYLHEEAGEASSSSYCLSPSCPHLKTMGRSRTEPDCPRSERAISSSRLTPELRRDLSIRKEQTLREVIGLSSYQHKMIMQYWPQVRGAGDFAALIFSKLCSRSVGARQLMTKANTVACFAQKDDCTTLHTRLTSDLIADAIRNLDSNHFEFTERLHEIGRAHCHLRGEGLSSGVWDDLGDAIVDSIRTHAAVKKHRELRRAWLALIAYITDNLKQGQRIQRVYSNLELCVRPATPSKKLSS